MSFKIPTQITAFDNGGKPIDISNDGDDLNYEPVNGEIINVLIWERWPSYDFIAGVPALNNPRYGDEIGFFQFRDTRAKEVKLGIYVDIKECFSIIHCFKKIRDISQITSPHLWAKHNQKTP